MRCEVFLVAMIATASPAAAQGVFDGTWQVDPASATFAGKPVTYKLDGGTYRCVTCTIPWQVAADGAPHAVTGQPGFDMVTATVTDPSTLSLVYARGGKTIDSETMRVSANGGTLTDSGTDTSAANGTPVEYKTVMTRVGAAPAAGLHPINGDWQPARATASAAGLMVTIQTSGKTVAMSFPTGEHWSATLGGPAVPVEGDPTGAMVKASSNGPRRLKLEQSRNGEVFSVATLAVTANGRLSYDTRNPKTGRTAHYIATKQ